MRGIAQELGVSAPALYRHVGNLENLIRLVVLTIDEDLAHIITTSVDMSGPRRTSGNLAEAVRQIRLWALRNPREFDLRFTAPARLSAGRPWVDLVTVRLLFEIGPDVSAPAWSRPFGALVLEVLGLVDSCDLADGSLVADAVDGLAGPSPSGRRLLREIEQIAQP